MVERMLQWSTTPRSALRDQHRWPRTIRWAAEWLAVGKQRLAAAGWFSPAGGGLAAAGLLAAINLVQWSTVIGAGADLQLMGLVATLPIVLAVAVCQRRWSIPLGPACMVLAVVQMAAPLWFDVSLRFGLQLVSMWGLSDVALSLAAGSDRTGAMTVARIGLRVAIVSLTLLPVVMAQAAVFFSLAKELAAVGLHRGPSILLVGTESIQPDSPTRWTFSGQRALGWWSCGWLLAGGGMLAIVPATWLTLAGALGLLVAGALWWSRATSSAIGTPAQPDGFVGSSTETRTLWSFITHAMDSALLGGLIWCLYRFAGELIPGTSDVLLLQIASAGLGVCYGPLLASWCRVRESRLVDLVIVALCLAYCSALPSWLLALATTISSAGPLVLLRTLIVAAPLGLAMGLFASRLMANPPRSDEQPALWHPGPANTLTHIAVTCGLAIAGGMLAAWWPGESVTIGERLRFACLALACWGGLQFLVSRLAGLVTQPVSPLDEQLIIQPLQAQRPSRVAPRWSPAIAGVAACWAVWTLARAEPLGVEPTVRWLFSTSSLLGVLQGLSPQAILESDEARCVQVLTTPNTTWSLWRFRGEELQLRDQGLPRGSFSAAPAIVPQPAPEVLQVVMAMTLHGQPRTVTILGLGSGVVLQTVGEFPIETADVYEADSTLWRLLEQRHPAPAWQDDRVTRRSIDPRWALAATTTPADLVLSVPPPCMSLGGAGHYTIEYYRGALAALAPEGVFCQRLSVPDFGVQPLLQMIAAAQSVFSETAVVEAGPGELLLFAAHPSGSLVRPDLLERLQTPQVQRVLSRSGWDWSLVLNLPAYDHDALAEVIARHGTVANRAANVAVVTTAAIEVQRWAPKLQEFQQEFLKERTSAPTYPPLVRGPADAQPVTRPCRSRLLEWIGEDGDDPDLLRRLADLASQRKLIRDNSESAWWDYRKAVRERLQSKPNSRKLRTAGQDEPELLPDYEYRRDYLAALGRALEDSPPRLAALRELETFLSRHDPLLHPFAHHEVAELYAKARAADSANPELLQGELNHRLHMIYFALPEDTSVRNIITTLQLLSREPQSLPDAQARWDHLNAVLAVLRQRWNQRQALPLGSLRVMIRDVEDSIQAADTATQTLTALAHELSYPQPAWEQRSTMLKQLLLRPLDGQREELLALQRVNQEKSLRARQQAAQRKEGSSATPIAN